MLPLIPHPLGEASLKPPTVGESTSKPPPFREGVGYKCQLSTNSCSSDFRRFAVSDGIQQSEIIATDGNMALMAAGGELKKP